MKIVIPRDVYAGKIVVNARFKNRAAAKEINVADEEQLTADEEQLTADVVISVVAAAIVVVTDIANVASAAVDGAGSNAHCCSDCR